MIDPSRVLILRVDPGFFVRMLQGHPMSRVDSDVPADAQIIDIWWEKDRYPGSIFLKVWSATFAPLLEGSTIPEWTPSFTTHRPGEKELFDMLGLGAREELGRLP